jgi:membrane protein YqaA with SNARE-associated domain
MPVNTPRVVYGTITVGVLLAVETATQETYAETVGSVVLALVVYWLAHSYAELTAQRIDEGQRLTRAGVIHSARHEAWILAGGALPVLPILIWWVAGGKLTNAVTAGIWTAAGMIVVYELVAGLRADLTAWELAVQTAVGATLGVLVIAIKVVLH